MGTDWPCWVIPTRPVIKINYFERLFTIQELKKLRVFEEDDFDVDKKLYAKEKSIADIEKNSAIFLAIGLILFWYITLQSIMIK